VFFVQESAGGIKGLNLSKSGSQAKDLPEMARHLVHMVQRIPNWENEWKLFTILIGHNDLCSSSCENNFNKIGLLPGRDTSPYAYRKHLEEALDIFRREKKGQRTSSFLQRSSEEYLQNAQV